MILFLFCTYGNEQMNIISGTARNLELADLPDSAVRPTAVRARKALFDSIGVFAGKTVLDLFSGSGALALEAASRGASTVVMVENDPAHVACIRENCRRVTAAGADAEKLILEFDALFPQRYLPKLPALPDLIFADPPYADSSKFFHRLLSDETFVTELSGSRLIWEVPDTPGALGEFMEHPALSDVTIRRFGGTFFLLGTIK